MKGTLFRILGVLLVASVCLVAMTTFLPWLGQLRPAPALSMRESLALDSLGVLRSDLNKSRLFPAIFLTDLRELEVDRLVEKDCYQMQKDSSQEYLTVPERFRPTTTRGERFLMLLTLQVFIKTMEEHGLTYFLYGGTLLGAFRHHGSIPWDDDIDVMVRSSDKERVCQVLSNVPGYQAFCPKKFQWKFFKKGLKTLEHHSHRWPFVDIFFFSEVSEQVIDDLSGKKLVYKRQDVFPLRYSPFEGAMLPVPRNISAVLEKEFQVEICLSLKYCHKTETLIREHSSLPCSNLSALYPFVQRLDLKSGQVREILTKGDKVLHTEDLPSISMDVNQNQTDGDPTAPMASTPGSTTPDPQTTGSR